jgi:hypothetical protein
MISRHETSAGIEWKKNKMIYIMDNGEAYEDHETVFVEGPDDFGDWWRNVYTPYIYHKAGFPIDHFSEPKRLRPCAVSMPTR